MDFDTTPEFDVPHLNNIYDSAPYLHNGAAPTLDDAFDLLSVATLESAPLIAIDTETTSTDPMRARLVGISLAVGEGEGYYIPVGHQTSDPQLPLEQVLAALRPSLTDSRKGKIGHNLKYDALVLMQHGLEVAPLVFDSMIAEWLVDAGSHRLVNQLVSVSFYQLAPANFLH